MLIHLHFGPWCWTLESSQGPIVLRHEEDEEPDEFSGRQVQDTASHHERVGFQPKPYETEGEHQ